MEETSAHVNSIKLSEGMNLNRYAGLTVFKKWGKQPPKQIVSRTAREFTEKVGKKSEANKK